MIKKGNSQKGAHIAAIKVMIWKEESYATKTLCPVCREYLKISYIFLRDVDTSLEIVA